MTLNLRFSDLNETSARGAFQVLTYQMYVDARRAMVAMRALDVTLREWGIR